MSFDWKTEIARIAYWKQVAAEHDKHGALPWHLPSVGASPEKIRRAQETADFEFPAEYSEFLPLADGWKGFCVLTDLYGTADFLNGRARMTLREPPLHEFLVENNIDIGNVVPIGSSDFDRDIFLTFSSASEFLPEGVLWYAGEEVDRYESFSAFLSAMVNYNAILAHEFAPKA